MFVHFIFSTTPLHKAVQRGTKRCLQLLVQGKNSNTNINTTNINEPNMNE